MLFLLLKTSYKENMKKSEVSKHGFYGIFHKAYNEKDNEKVVIVLGGSEGNEKIPMEIGRMFAENGINGNGSMFAKSFTEYSEFTWKGKDIQCIKVKTKYFRLFLNLIKEQQINMCYLYENALKNFDEAAAIRVEDIKGDI